MNRGQRRYLKEKKIKKRMEMIKNLDASAPIFDYSQLYLADHSKLGCPDGRKCTLCHPVKRIPTKQEKLEDGQE